MKNYTLSSHAEKVILERNLNTDWIQLTLEDPDKIEFDANDNNLIHNLKIIKDCDNKVLRVIYKKSTEPILLITAFFDRRMKGKIQ